MRLRSAIHLIVPSPPLVFLTFLSLAFFMTLSSQAQRRDFAASYQLSNIVESGDQVSVTVTLKLFNYSGGEIRNGAVVLKDSRANVMSGRESADSNLLGAFNLIPSLPAYQETTLRHRFSIPASEYALWNQGREPELVFLKPDAEGNAQSVHIDLRRDFAPAKVTQDGPEVAK
jgi:hypothetical protein